MPYQEYRGNSENKLFYIINDLYKGMNTEYSDDSSNDNEFDIMLNFDLSTTGSLVKRLGWGRVDSVSEILKKFEILPTSYLKNEDHPNPDSINDILLYMKHIFFHIQIFHHNIRMIFSHYQIYFLFLLQ